MCSSEDTFSVMDFRPSGKFELVRMDLTHGFKPGMVLDTIVSSSQERSEFNVYANDKSTILMTCELRFLENIFVFNIYQYDRWGDYEERVSPLPVGTNTQYRVHIAYHTKGYRVFINGDEIYFFKHRLSYEPAMFEVWHTTAYFVSYNLNHPKWCTQDPDDQLYLKEYETGGREAPVEIEIEQGKSLSWIIIKGMVKENATRFDINIRDYQNEILLNFSAKLDENKAVLNSYLGGSWGEKEITNGLPFKQSEKFVLAIDVEDICYKIYVNGSEYVTYQHRAPIITIAKVQIVDDVKLLKITYRK